MQTTLTKTLFVSMLNAALKKIEENFDYLNELDSATGDGDHGTAIVSTMKAAVAAANENDVSFSELLSKIGWAIMSATGGSTSSLNGSFYLGMSEAVSSEELSPADTAKMFAQGLENLRAMTTAQLGDKTMLDAIIPAVESMKITLEGNPEASLNDLFRNAVTAAVEGAAKTEELVAKQGRARNLGERSLGFRDAGATSFSLIMTAFAETVAQS